MALTPTPVHSVWNSSMFLNGLCPTILSSLQISPLLWHFLPHLSIIFLLSGTLRAASFVSNGLLWLVIAHDVSDHVLDNCQVSSGSNDCVAYWTRLRHNLKSHANVLRLAIMTRMRLQYWNFPKNFSKNEKSKFKEKMKYNPSVCWSSNSSRMHYYLTSLESHL